MKFTSEQLFYPIW